MTPTTIENKNTNQVHAIKTYDDFEHSDNAEDIVTYIMLKVGMRSHVAGFYYVKRAIVLVVEDPKNALYMTKDLYYRIAREFGVSWCSVERGMRSAIKIIDCSDEIKERYIGYAEKTYTNAKFISAVAELVRRNLR